MESGPGATPELSTGSRINEACSVAGTDSTPIQPVCASVMPRARHQRSTTVRATFIMLPRDISQSTICVPANR